MRKVGSFASLNSHPATFRCDPFASLLAHLERRLADLFPRRLRLTRIRVQVGISAHWIPARSGIEVRLGTEYGRRSNESESEGFDLQEMQRSVHRVAMKECTTHLLARLVLDSDVDVTSLACDPRSSVHLR